MAFSSAEGITLRIYRLWLWEEKKTCNSLFRQFTDLRFLKTYFLVAKLLGFFELRGEGKKRRKRRV